MKKSLLFCIIGVAALGFSGAFSGFGEQPSHAGAIVVSDSSPGSNSSSTPREPEYSATSILSGLLSELLGGLIVSADAQQSNPEVQASIDYVNNLTEDCVLDHGYQCAEVAGDTFLEPTSESKRIPGRWLEAWPAALTALVTSQDLSTEQKLLRHYKIGFAEDETHYLILFDALSLPRLEDGKMIGLLSASIGKSMKIWVDKETLSVTDMKFLR